MTSRPSDDRRRDADSSALWRLSGMGFEIVSEVLAGLVIGWLLDHWLGTGPTLLIIGGVLGIGVAMTNFLRQALKLGASGRPQKSRSDRPRERGDDR